VTDIADAARDGAPQPAGAIAEAASERSVAHVLDAGEASCGELLLLVFRAMKQIAPGQLLEVVGYDTGALEDIPAWCRLTRNSLLGIERTKPARFLIRKGA
jgi:tRNA 2-thiouridine synthesizing protein A